MESGSGGTKPGEAGAELPRCSRLYFVPGFSSTENSPEPLWKAGFGAEVIEIQPYDLEKTLIN